ncbi:MAG: hypothetical protein RLZZ628_4095 [Bacteroidota bacterium]|jgi:hypothetical protein
MNKIVLVIAIIIALGSSKMIAQHRYEADVVMLNNNKNEATELVATTTNTTKIAFETFPEIIEEYFLLKCDWTLPQYGVLDFTFFDKTGKVISRTQKAVSEGTQIFKFEVNELPTGIYNVMVSQRDWSALMENCFIKVK